MSLTPISFATFDPSLHPSESSPAAELSPTEIKTKRVGQGALGESPQKKERFTPHPLEFLIPRSSRYHFKDTLNDLESMMNRIDLPPSFLSDFQTAYQSVFTKIPPGIGRINLFQNFIVNYEESSPYDLAAMTELAGYVDSLSHIYNPKNLYHIQNFFIEYAEQCWEELYQCLKIFHDHCTDLHSFLKYSSCIDDVFRTRWIEFTYFYIAFHKEDNHPIPIFMNFFFMFDRVQIEKILRWSTPSSRKILFQDDLQPAEQHGLELLACSSLDFLELFFYLVDELEKKDLRLHSRFLLIPHILGIKKSPDPYQTLIDFVIYIERYTSSVDQLLFFLDKGSNLQAFKLDGCHFPLQPNLFGPLCCPQFPLIVHLYNSFRISADFVTKKVLAESLSSLMDEEEDEIIFQSSLESDVILRIAQEIRQYFDLLPETPRKIDEKDPAFPLLLEYEAVFFASWNLILVKDTTYFKNPMHILNMLISSRAARLEDLQFLFVPPNPTEEDGLKQFKLPPTEDLGGPTRQFYTRLIESLFRDEAESKLSIDEQGFIFCDPKTKKGDSLNLTLFGRLLSILLENRIPTGPLFNPKVYRLIQKLKSSIECNSLSFYREIDFIVYGDRLLNDPNPSPEKLKEIQTLLCLDPSDDLDHTVLEMLRSQHDPRIEAANMILSGLNLENHFMFRAEPVEVIQEMIEGIKISPETITRLCHFKRPFEEISPELAESLTEDELKTKKEDSEAKTGAFQAVFENWIANASVKQRQAFMVATTGSPSFHQEEAILIHFQKGSNNANVHKETNCVMHTCTKSLEIFLDNPKELSELLDQIAEEKQFNII